MLKEDERCSSRNLVPSDAVFLLERGSPHGVIIIQLTELRLPREAR